MIMNNPHQNGWPHGEWWMLGDNPVGVSKMETHLGLQHLPNGKATETISNNIAKPLDVCMRWLV